MLKRYLVTVVMAVAILGAFAQQQHDPTNYMKTDLIPASPNAASLGKYGEIPVNLSTGAANLSIPIFTVTGTDLSLPITLNYSYDGFRPAETPGWVGLGWSLNAGGVISRTVKGMVDGTTGNNTAYDSDTVQNKLHNLGINSPDHSFLENVAIGNYDTEPDVYSFNFGGYSGKFIKFKGKFYCFPYQKLKIAGGGGAFSIVTEDGTKYWFDAIETTSPKNTGSGYVIPTYISSWYLTKITNAAGTENIRLIYTSDGTVEQIGAYTQTYKKFESTNSSQPGASDLLPAQRTYPTFVDSKRLIGIVSEKYSVSFIGGIFRQDVKMRFAGDAPQMLTNIQVHNPDGTKIKDIAFNHNYFVGDNNEKWLKLTSIVDYGMTSLGTRDTLQQQKHSFQYHEGGAPSKTQPKVDHYGYYISGNFGSIILPTMFHPYGVDRSPSYEGTIVGALQSVTYPTGGTTTFDYELNRVSNGFVQTGNNLQTSYTINRPSGNISIISNPESNNPFTINVAQTITVQVDRIPYIPNDIFAKNKYKEFEIWSMDDDAYTVVASGEITLEADNHKAYTFDLPVGQYLLRVWSDYQESYVSVGLAYFQATGTAPISSPASGLRIKTIVSNSVIGRSTTKEYDYTNANGSSSGVMTRNSYESKSYTEIRGDGYVNFNYVFTNFSSTIAENYYQGVPFYYTSVVESATDGTSKISTRTDFEPFDQYHLGIEPKRITRYKTSSGQLVPLDKTENTYTMVIDTQIIGYRPQQIVYGNNVAPNQYTFDSYGYSQAWKYLSKVRNVRYEGTDSLVTVTDNGYDVNGTRNLLMTKTTGSDGKQNISRFKYPESYTSSINSGFIAANVIAPVWEKQDWTKSGSDSLLVSSTLTHFNPTLFKPDTVYTLVNVASLNNNGKDGNGKYTALESDSRFEPRVAFTYDSFGKVIRQQLTQGAPVSYRWGYKAIDSVSGVYNKGYVIAEAKNAAENEFFVENFEENTDGGLVTGLAHTGNKYRLPPYEVTWVKPNNRNYVITYWYRSNGVWLLKPEQPYVLNIGLLGGDAYDDIRVYPKDAQLSTYTLIPGIGLSSAIDAKYQTTYFEYDGLNRLINIRDQYRNIVKHIDYHFKNQ